MSPASALIPECSLRSSCIVYFAMENASDAVLWSDKDGTLLYANQSAARLLEVPVEDILASNLSSLFPAIADHLNAPATQPFECVCMRPDGSEIAVEVSLSSFDVEGHSCHCMFVRDVSARKRLELQLRHAHTMEAVGRLVDGVSHDFNNLLTAVMIYLGLMSNQLSPASPARQHLDRIMQATEDGRALVASLRGLGRNSATEIAGTPVTIADVITGMSEMLKRLLGEDILLTIDCSNNVSRVCIDRLQIEQLLLNLAVNARDAMPDGGELSIDLRDCDGDSGGERHDLKPGCYVKVEIRDTGCGMDADTLSHIFEPFFTTKTKGRGTGLGMATVYGIVQQCGGHIELSSHPGRGTTVTILLPKDGSAPVNPPAPPRSEPEIQGNETVLLVEDEELVRRSIEDILTARGYHVLEARNAEEAVSAAEGFGGRIHLMVTDLVLPGKCGSELAENLKRRRPDMRVLYMSGYENDERVRRVTESGEPFCAKPFTAAALSQKMREVLSAPAPQP